MHTTPTEPAGRASQRWILPVRSKWGLAVAINIRGTVGGRADSAVPCCRVGLTLAVICGSRRRFAGGTVDFVINVNLPQLANS